MEYAKIRFWRKGGRDWGFLPNSSKRYISAIRSSHSEQRRRGNLRVSAGRPFESTGCVSGNPRVFEEKKPGISMVYVDSDVVLSRSLLSLCRRLIPGIYPFGGMGEKPHLRDQEEFFCAFDLQLSLKSGLIQKACGL